MFTEIEVLNHDIRRYSFQINTVAFQRYQKVVGAFSKYLSSASNKLKEPSSGPLAETLDNLPEPLVVARILGIFAFRSSTETKTRHRKLVN